MKVNHIRVSNVVTTCQAVQDCHYPLTRSMFDEQLCLEQYLKPLKTLMRYKHRKKKPHENYNCKEK